MISTITTEWKYYSKWW